MPREKKSAKKRRRVPKKDPWKMSPEEFLRADQADLPGSVPLTILEHFLGVQKTRRLNFTTKYTLENVNPCTTPFLVKATPRNVTTKSFRECLEHHLEQTSPGAMRALRLRDKANALLKGAL